MAINTDVLDNKYMRIALENGMRSKANFKVGACVVNPNGKVIAMGYNSILFPEFHKECAEKKYSWMYRYNTINLAIESALSNSNVDYKNATVYATTYPSMYCVKEMAKKGIRRVVFYNDKRPHIMPETYYEDTNQVLKESCILSSPFKAQDDEFDDATEDDDTKDIRLKANLVNTQIEKYRDYKIRGW
ncbi:deoxycytidylate deaminase-like [Onthophagus taurus]|uniref:deoxycytidylate deaminase-like n=1 Tax=Onthophagus taurus TaxID=166361 RepID=UPI0039BE8649